MNVRSLAARFLEGVGLADISLASATASLASLSNDGLSLRRVAETSDSRAALEHLSTLSFPDTRHVAFAASASPVWLLSITAVTDQTMPTTRIICRGIWDAGLLVLSAPRVAHGPMARIVR